MCARDRQLLLFITLARKRFRRLDNVLSLQDYFTCLSSVIACFSYFYFCVSTCFLLRTHEDQVLSDELLQVVLRPAVILDNVRDSGLAKDIYLLLLCVFIVEL